MPRPSRDYGDVLVITLGIAFTIASRHDAPGLCLRLRHPFPRRPFGDMLLFVTLIAIFGGYLVKIYAWKSILGRDGIINGVPGVDRRRR